MTATLRDRLQRRGATFAQRYVEELAAGECRHFDKSLCAVSSWRGLGKTFRTHMGDGARQASFVWYLHKCVSYFLDKPKPGQVEKEHFSLHVLKLWKKMRAIGSYYLNNTDRQRDL